jgi:flagellin-specific chaperone FliS
MAKVLIDANRTNDLEKLREVSGLLETVADGWASMAEEFKQ